MHLRIPHSPFMHHRHPFPLRGRSTIRPWLILLRRRLPLHPHSRRNRPLLRFETHSRAALRKRRKLPQFPHLIVKRIRLSGTHLTGLHRPWPTMHLRHRFDGLLSMLVHPIRLRLLTLVRQLLEPLSPGMHGLCRLARKVKDTHLHVLSTLSPVLSSISLTMAAIIRSRLVVLFRDNPHPLLFPECRMNSACINREATLHRFWIRKIRWSWILERRLSMLCMPFLFVLLPLPRIR